VIVLTLSSIDWEKTGGFEKQFADDEDPNANKEIKPLDEGDIQLLKTYGQGPYARTLKKLDDEIKEVSKRVNDKIGVKESDMGLAPPNLWDLLSDRQRMNEEHPLQVARCTKIIQNPDDPEKGKYIINVKQIAKFGKNHPSIQRLTFPVVNLGERVSPTDIEEGMRVGVDRQKYSIQLPLPPKIDPSVTMMQVEEKPDVTYSDVGGCKEQIERLREVVEVPLLSPERFVNLGIDPPKGVMLYGPPGTGKTLCARAVANRTDATFIRVIGSELVQKYFRPCVLQALIADTSVKELEWCENYSRWLVPRRPASSSLTKLMLLVEQDLMMAQEATMKSNVPCLNSLPNSTVSILEGTLKSCLLQIGQVH